MNGHRSRAARRGISLLEVLISIGILSIGLISALALIPAGRTYLRKAEVADRAAALVSNAYATTNTLGLLRFNALTWDDIPMAKQGNPESAPVIREQAGRDVFSVPGSATGLTYDAGWRIATIDTETIDRYHAASPPPTVISGVWDPAEVSTPPPTISVVLTGTSGKSSSGTINSSTSSRTVLAGTDGRWSLGGLSLPAAPDMTIHGSGPNVGQPSNESFTDYSVTAFYDGTAAPVDAKPSPATFRLHGRRRALDQRAGQVETTYTRPANAVDGNANAAAARLLDVPNLENAVTVGQNAGGRNIIGRSVQRLFEGTLWRMELGTRRAAYRQFVDFDDVNNAPPRPRSIGYPNRDISANAGDSWLGSSPDVLEDQDWYRIEVSAGEAIRIEFSDPTDALSTELGGRKFPVYLNTTSVTDDALLKPVAALSGEGYDYYSIPNDGFVITRAALKRTLVNTFGPAGKRRNERQNPGYTLTVGRYRSERAVVVDPLMATRLDKVLELNGRANPQDPYSLRRLRFADFQQQFAGTNTSRAFVIPRLNYRAYAFNDLDTMLAMAERNFRNQDNIAISVPDGEDESPVQIFDRTSTGIAVRRQAEGRMSWMLMLQPEDPGPVSVNWKPGRYFEVSIIVFEDRKLPPLVAEPPLDGEYAFEAEWSDVDGMIAVTIPAAVVGTALDEDDIRSLFRVGGWILVAPRTTYTAAPLDDTQRLDWSRIQTSRMEKRPDGSVLVRVLPESEPADTILYRSRRTVPNVSPVIVMAYQGVVTVVTKSMQLQP